MTHEQDLENLAREICRKPSTISLETCHESWGRTNPLCNDYDQCRILEKSPEQICYVLHSSNNENVFLEACPGSGKTEVVGLKAAYTIQTWQRLPCGIAVLTFTNNAASIISDRVSQFTGDEKIGYPHFIGTIDSWLHGYIANPFAHLRTGYEGQNGDRSIRIVDEHDDNPWLNTYKLDTAFSYFRGETKDSKMLVSTPLYANKIRFDHETQRWEIKNPYSRSSEYITDEEYYTSEPFTNFRKDRSWLSLERMRNGFREKKDLFSKAGFATYQDVENLCFEILCNNSVLCGLMARRFPFIIVDECQDLSWIQLQILDKLREQGAVLHFVGDLYQAIYEFKKVNPATVKTFTEDKHFAVFPLSINFRSCQPIINLCNRVVRNSRAEKSAQEQIVDKPCICIPYPDDQMHLLPIWFSEYLDQMPRKQDESAIVGTIVTRNWNNVSRLRPSRNDNVKGPPKTLAAALQLWKYRSSQSLDDALKYMGRFITDKYFPQYSSNPRHHYCPDCLDSYLRWRLFLSKVLSACCDDGCTMSDLQQSWSTWAQIVRSQFGTIIRVFLPIIEGNLKNTPPDFRNLDGNAFKAPSREGDKNVSGTLPRFSGERQETNLRITTIHSVKGETLDAILLVSAPTVRGTQDGYWTQWLADPTFEAARLAFVASSRPKYLLAWAIPKTDNEDELNKIRRLGFHIIDMPTSFSSSR